MTIGADGLGLISYYDLTNGDLKVAHCTNVACTSATTQTLDEAGTVGHHTSVTVGADGLGLISYLDVSNFDLKVAHCANVACTSATTQTLDGTGTNVGQYTSVTVGADGLGLISYFDGTNGNLKVAHCANVACTSATTQALDSTGNVGQYTSVTVGADGLGLISYLRRDERRSQGRPLRERRLHERDHATPRQRRRRRPVHLGDGGRGRARPDQLLRRDERRSQGRPLRERRLLERDHADAGPTRRRRSGRPR